MLGREGAPAEIQMTHTLNRCSDTQRAASFGDQSVAAKPQASVIAYNELASQTVQVLFEQVHLHDTIQMAKAFTALIAIPTRFTCTVPATVF